MVIQSYNAKFRCIEIKYTESLNYVVTKRARFATLIAISMIVDHFCLLQQYEIKQNQNTIAAIDHKRARLQNSPYFCVFRYARAVKQRVWNEAKNSERDWGETLKTIVFFLSLSLSRVTRTPYGRTHVRLARFARVRILSHTFEKKRTVLQSITACQFVNILEYVSIELERSVYMSVNRNLY